jgi:hypothetical protein
VPRSPQWKTPPGLRTAPRRSRSFYCGARRPPWSALGGTNYRRRRKGAPADAFSTARLVPSCPGCTGKQHPVTAQASRTESSGPNLWFTLPVRSAG